MAIKSLQFRKLCRSEGKNAEEWMGRLCIAAVECNYKEIDCQLKEQFIHGLNDKTMLNDIIRELITKNINEQMTSEDMLIWAKRVELQRAQAQKMDKVKVAKNKECIQHLQISHVDIEDQVMHQGSVQHMESVCQLWKNGPLQEGMLEQERQCGS